MDLLQLASMDHGSTCSPTIALASSDRFRRTFEKAPIGLAHVSPDGRWLEVNERLCAILGYARERLLATTFQELTHPDDLEADLGKVKAVLAHEIDGYSMEKRYLREDRSVVWCNLTVSLVWASVGVPGYFIAAVEDVSARRVAEERLLEMQDSLEAKVADRTAALSASDGRYRLLAESANEMIATMATDGTVLFVTPAVRRVLGYDPEEIVGRTTMSLTHPADVPETRALFGHLVKAGPGAASTPYEFRARHKDGRWVWLEGQPRVEYDRSGRPVAFHDVVRDVSARKEVEEALRLSQAFLSRTSAAAGVGGWELDAVSSKLLWSEKTCLLQEVPRDFQPTLEQAFAFYEPEFRPVIAQAVQRALEDGTGWDLELQMVTARGRQFWARSVGTAEITDGRVVRLIGALQDITDWRQVLRDLAERQEQFRVTLESIGDAVITTDAAGNVTWLNREAGRLLGCDGDAIGRPLQDVARMVEHGCERTLRFPHPEHVPCSLPRNTVLKNAVGRTDVDGTVSPVLEQSRGCLGHVIVFRDVSAERSRERDLEYQAQRDPLTGLLNRRAFEDRLSQRASSGEGSAGLLVIDLDGFKQVNDTLGHAAGDRILRQVAELLRAEASNSEVECVGRLGGDEFALLLDCDTSEAALRVADRLCAGVARFRFTRDDGSFGLGASIGVVTMSPGRTEIGELMEAADQACYRAKRAGKSRAMLGRVLAESA